MISGNNASAGGDTRSSRLLYENQLKSEADWLRRDAARRLQQLDAIDQIADLEHLIALYEQRFGDPPPTWQHMIDARYLRELPRDPAGHEYLLNPWWGDVSVNPESPIWPLPTEIPA